VLGCKVVSAVSVKMRFVKLSVGSMESVLTAQGMFVRMLGPVSGQKGGVQIPLLIHPALRAILETPADVLMITLDIINKTLSRESRIISPRELPAEIPAETTQGAFSGPG